jgi:uncharacterized protein (TIGR02266 family)
MGDPREKRSDQRVPLILQVQYPDRDGSLKDTTENLSAGGLFLRTDRSLAAGDRIPLQIGFPGLLPPLVIEVEVVRLRHPGEEGPPGVAVRIPSDRDEDRRALARLVATRPGDAAPPRPYRILVVEDNALLTEMFRQALGRIGTTDGHPLDVEARYVVDGEAALRAIHELMPDLLMTDLFMPVMDGFELLRRVRENPSTRALPVLVVSSGDTEAKLRALAAGADFYLGKPVQFAELIATLRRLLARA